MPTTSNFGWTTPADTDLVKDGAAAIRTLGNGIDTSLVDLKGGTTGQVLSKASNTDLDYTWVTTDDANAIQNAIVNAKGDIIGASANDTPAITSVGSNGDNLVADSGTSTGLRWQGNYAAGKNKIINGDFNINQRGFTSNTASGYGFDRWLAVMAGDGTATYSTQAFTLGSAPVAGYEAKNFARFVTTGQTTTASRANWDQRIESVRTFAGQTVTVSLYAKAASGTPSITLEFLQDFGSGGSPSAAVTAIGSEKKTLSTSWARYSMTVAIPSISGKTIGTDGNDRLGLAIWVSAGSDFNTRSNSLGIQSNTFDIWGVQVEAGSVATAFQTATGTIQGELALAQRYYFRINGGAAYYPLTTGGFSNTTTTILAVTPFPSEMRIAPTALEQTGTAANYGINESGGGYTCSAVPSFNAATKTFGAVQFTVASGLTIGRGAWGRNDNNSTAYLAWSAEL